MSVYEVELEDGSVYEVEVDDAPAVSPTRPASLGERAYQAGKSFLTGAANMADLNPLAPKSLFALPYTEQVANLSKQLAPSSFAKNRLGIDAIPNEQGDIVFGPGTSIVNKMMEAAAIPGNQIVNAISGATGEAAHLLFPESKIAPLIGALAPAGATGVAKGAVNKLASWGKGFERSSIGAGVKDYVASLKKGKLYEDDETGDVVTKLRRSINDIGSREGWGINRSPQAIAQKVEAKLDEYGSVIGGMINKAEQANIKPQLNWSRTQAIIDDPASVASKDDMVAVFDDFKNRFFNSSNAWRGDVTGLHNWSKGLRDIGFSGSAAGNIKPNVVRRVQAAIGMDMQDAVKGAVRKAGYSTDEVEDIFQRYSDYATVAPVAKYNVAKSEAESLDKTTRGLIRTSGGVATLPLVGGATGAALGGAAGAGVLPGLAAGAALGMLGTQTGRGIAGNVLKGAAWAGNKALRGANLPNSLPGSTLAGVFAGRAPQEQLFAQPAQTEPQISSTSPEKEEEDGMDPLQLIREREGLRLKAYRDQGGKLTIGYGHTGNVKLGDEITEQEAERLLQQDASKAIEVVANTVDPKIKLTHDQLAALVSLVFNIGPQAFAKSTLLKRINAGDPNAAEEFLRWNKVKGVEVEGLTNRRQQEASLFGILNNEEGA